jgi:hypothetical protein
LIHIIVEIGVDLYADPHELFLGALRDFVLMRIERGAQFVPLGQELCRTEPSEIIGVSDD